MATFISIIRTSRSTTRMKQLCMLNINAKCKYRNGINILDNVRTLNLSATYGFSYIASCRFYATENARGEQKLSIFQRFKQMYRDYWYVLLPVHIVTSIGWFGSFYYLAKSGVDIAAVLENLHISKKFADSLRDSSMGYLAVAYALYKIATPARYTVTLGGTTISINYLKKWGYIKPVPSTQELKDMYQEKKENIMTSMKDKRHELMMKKDQFVEKTDDILEDMEKKIKTKLKDSIDRKDIINKFSKDLKIKSKEPVK